MKGPKRFDYHRILKGTTFLQFLGPRLLFFSGMEIICIVATVRSAKKTKTYEPHTLESFQEP
jgi:hypothetical protein